MKNIFALLLFSALVSNPLLFSMNITQHKYDKTYTFNDTIVEAFFIDKNHLIIATQEGKLNFLNVEEGSLKQLSLYDNYNKKPKQLIQTILYSATRKHICALSNIYASTHKQQIIPQSDCYFINLNKKPYTIHKKHFKNLEVYFVEPEMNFIITRNLVVPQFSIHILESNYKNIDTQTFNETLIQNAYHASKKLCAFHTGENNKHKVLKLLSTENWKKLWCIREAHANHMSFSSSGQWLAYNSRNYIRIINTKQTKVIEVAFFFPLLLQSIDYDGSGILQIIDKNHTKYIWQQAKNIWLKIQENNIPQHHAKIIYNQNKHIKAQTFNNKVKIYQQYQDAYL